jgi:hypothetical protein
MHFKTMQQVDVPQAQNGKQKLTNIAILKDLDRLEAGSAIQVPLRAESCSPQGAT